MARPSSAPHITGCTRDSHPHLDDGRLNTGEVGVGLGLLYSRLDDPAYDACRYLSANVFSAVGMHVRVLQFWIDRQRPTQAFIRCSGIYKFERGERGDNWDDWLTLLCWLVGAHVEET